MLLVAVVLAGASVTPGQRPATVAIEGPAAATALTAKTPAGPSWTRVDSAVGSAAGFGPMTYDAADGYMLLYGMSYVVGSGTCSTTQLWAFADGNWSERILASAPEFSTASLAYDAYDGYVVLFGGCSTDSNQTWTYHSGHWTNLTSAVAPPARAGGEMAYDPALNAVVLFGGYVYLNRTTGAGERANDTWEFQAGTWRNVTTSEAPPARDLYAMAFDSAANSLVLFGGSGAGAGGSTGGGCCHVLDDTWTLDSLGWHNDTAGLAPAARESAAISDYPDGNDLILFGGEGAPSAGRESGSTFNDTWELSGGLWQNVSVGAGPPARSAADLAYDPAEHEVVLFGGYNGSTLLNDTWMFGIPLGSTSAPTSNGESWILLIAGASGVVLVGVVLALRSHKEKPSPPAPGQSRLAEGGK